MYLQGSLHHLFDALYVSGVVQRVLQRDWKEIQSQKEQYPQVFSSLIQQLNQTPYTSLLSFLQSVPTSWQDIIALEVAYEYAQFSERSTVH